MASEFQTQQLALASQKTRLPFLAALNEQGRTAFASVTMPTRKTEAWKYTSLHNLSTSEFIAPESASITAELQAACDIKELKTARLVFINGQLDTGLSDALTLPEVCLFSQADAQQQAVIAEQLGSILAQTPSTTHLFNDLNNASVNDGVLIHIGKNQQLAQPIQIVQLTTANPQPFCRDRAYFAGAGKSAAATLIEQYGSDTAAQSSFTNAITEIAIGANARLQHYRLQTQQEDGAAHWQYPCGAGS